MQESLGHAVFSEQRQYVSILFSSEKEVLKVIINLTELSLTELPLLLSTWMLLLGGCGGGAANI